MTFTFDLDTPTDRESVRFHIGDTDEATSWASDELIAWRLTEDGSVAAAVLNLINYAISLLAAEPDMTADWLKIDWRRSSENWMELRRRKQIEFGLGAQDSSGGSYSWRPDTRQTEEPTYPETTDEL